MDLLCKDYLKNIFFVCFQGTKYNLIEILELGEYHDYNLIYWLNVNKIDGLRSYIRKIL